jgi:uncharacterized membrane protein YvlD (DUF360 family)
MWWSLTAIGMWVSAAISTKFTKDSDSLMAAIIGNICLGIFYLILKGHL